MSLAPPRPQPFQIADVVVPLIGGAMPYLAGSSMETVIASGGLAFFALRVSRSDYRSRLIYHADLAGFASIGFGWLVCAGAEPAMDLLRGVIHSCAYAAAFETVRRLYRSVRGRPGMGPADVTLAAALGPILDVEWFGWALVVGALVGICLVGIRWLTTGRRPGRYSYLPFGATLVSAGYLVWLAGQMWVPAG